MPEWIVLIFVFAFGSCIGSFLNVVIYRLPRDKSLVKPPSSCPACGRHIRFYDNIPILSWIFLGAKCRYCKAPISPRYIIIEALTGMIFVALFVLYFLTDKPAVQIDGQAGIKAFLNGGWFIYLLHIILLSGLIAASAIDLELWVIPIFLCWFVTVVGLAGSVTAPFVIPFVKIAGSFPLPRANPVIAALTAGAFFGLIVSVILLVTGLIKRSYESRDESADIDESKASSQQEQFNHRIEMFREIIFLIPIIACSIIVYFFARDAVWWQKFSKFSLVEGFLGSLWGYFVGCAVVWATRIFGTLVFGREAMGLGDVHLMGAAGAFIGPWAVVLAFFIAPFFGLAWAVFQMFFKKTRQIPYGPFLSMGIFTVMIFQKFIVDYLNRFTITY